MAQFWHDFSEDGLTGLTVLSPSGEGAAGSEPSISGGLLELPGDNQPDFDPTWRVVFPYDLGEDHEIYVVWANPVDPPGFGIFRGGFATAPTNEEAYFNQLFQDDRHALRILTSAGNASTIANEDDISLDPSQHSEIFSRLTRRNSDNSLSAEFGVVGSSADTTVSTTSSTYNTTGGVAALFNQRSGTAFVVAVGVGTFGDPAPIGPTVPVGGVSYGEGFYETVASGVAAVDEVEVALMSGTTVVETLTTTTSPTASSGSINWLPSQLTFQSVDGTFNNVRVRVRVDGALTFADVGTWAAGNQSPGGNNVTVSNITTTNNSEPAFGVLAGADTFTEPVRFQLLDSSDAVLIESVETVGIGPGPDYLFLGSADIQNTTGDTITITGLSLRLDTGTGEVDFATGMTLVDDDTFSTPLSAELQNNQVLSLTETRITYTEED